VVLLHGAGLGVISFAIAELSLRFQLLDPTSHDLKLAQRLGLLYAPAAGAWLGWLQRSRSRAPKGVVAGLLLGAVYFVLCMSQNFFAIMVGFPALLGSGLAAMVGSNRSSGVGAFFGRMLKGFFAGLVLGYAYMLLLNVILFVPWQLLGGVAYASQMWRGGLPAMGIASALFLVLLRWAVGLVRLQAEQL
jgi:hypothetical protein